MMSVDEIAFVGAEQTATQPKKRLNARAIRDYGVLLLVVALFVVLSVSVQNFLTLPNLMNVLDQNAPLMLLALGTTFVILTGAFDLSSGQITSLTLVLAVELSFSMSNPVWGMILALVVAVLLGVVNGYLVARFHINSFLTTLASGLAISGLALYVTSGPLVDLTVNRTFTFIGTSRLGGWLPISVILCTVTFLVFTGILRYMRIGRHIFALGSNEEAARISGIGSVKIRIFAYAMGALAAGVGGLILASETGAGRIIPNADGLMLNGIAAVVIGGTSISGGRGAMWRTVVGVLLLAFLQNAFNMLGVPPYWQTIVTGSVILLAVLVNASTERTH